MTDRVDELAQQVQHAVLADIAYRIASGQVGPTNQSMPAIVWKQHIAAALRVHAEEARREEREACCKDVCTRCASGSVPAFQSDPRPMWWHEASRCSAAAILARGEKR